MAPSDAERLATLEERMTTLTGRVGDLERSRRADRERVAKLERGELEEHARADVLAELEKRRDRRDGRRLALLGAAIALSGVVGQVLIALLLRAAS